MTKSRSRRTSRTFLGKQAPSLSSSVCLALLGSRSRGQKKRSRRKLLTTSEHPKTDARLQCACCFSCDASASGPAVHELPPGVQEEETGLGLVMQKLRGYWQAFFFQG